MTRFFSVKVGGFLVIAALSLLCFTFPASASDRPLQVYGVNYPLKYFAERIGGPYVKVTLPVPPDVDPVYWVPSITDIGAYQRSDVILLNGAGYAKWITKVSLPRAKTIDTSRSFKDRYITIQEITTHSHGPQGQHAHEDPAFTTWLDLSLAAQQAESVYRAFSRKRPELKSKFKTNYESLANDLMFLDGRLKKIVAKNATIPLLFSHPVYDYLIHRYGIHAKSVHWEPDQEPTTDQLSELTQILENHRAKWMVWEGDPIKAAAEKLNEMGIASVVYNPCANVPKQGDFITVMKKNVSNIETVFQ